jgi:uncharacterized protein (UPF0335 family)
MGKPDDKQPYKLPLTHDEQIELLGELMSARARIKRLEECVQTLTEVVQDVMMELKEMHAVERKRLDKHLRAQ